MCEEHTAIPCAGVSGFPQSVLCETVVGGDRDFFGRHTQCVVDQGGKDGRRFARAERDRERPQFDELYRAIGCAKGRARCWACSTLQNREQKQRAGKKGAIGVVQNYSLPS